MKNLFNFNSSNNAKVLNDTINKNQLPIKPNKCYMTILWQYGKYGKIWQNMAYSSNISKLISLKGQSTGLLIDYFMIFSVNSKSKNYRLKST